MWLGEMIIEINKAVIDIDVHNYGNARKRLLAMVEDAKQNGVVTMIKID